MKTIWLKDLRLKVNPVIKEVVKKREPLFLGMKKKDIFKIESRDDCIYWYNKDWLQTYFETSDWYWSKKGYKDWLPTYFETSDGYWWKKGYKDWLEIYFENSNGDWSKRKYKDWLVIYYETSNGYWRKTEWWKKIEYVDWKYYIDWEEAELI